jgi:hypothetical protein
VVYREIVPAPDELAQSKYIELRGALKPAP